MTLNRSSLMALSGVSLAVVAVTALVTSSVAQGPARQDYMGDQVKQPYAPPPMVMQAPQGPATMVADGSHLYVLQGNRLLKVKKSDLSVEKEKSLRPRSGGPQMPPPTGYAK